MEDYLPLSGEGWRGYISLDTEPARDGMVMVVHIFLNVVVVFLPQYNELLSPLEHVLAVSGNTSAFASF